MSQREMFQLRLLKDEETGEYSLAMVSSDSRFKPPDEFCFGKEGSKVVDAVLNLLSMPASIALSPDVEETKTPDES